MERRDFLKKTSQAGLTSGCLFMANGGNLFAQTKKTKVKDKEQIFKENWIKSLMENMEKQHDKKTRIKLMESCGRSCARRGGFFKTAESCKGNVKKLVETFAKYLGKENKYIKEDVVQVVYKKCLCELVEKGPDILPETYCFCSQGWIYEIFETAAQKPVKVETIQTVKRGASSCKFIIRL